MPERADGFHIGHTPQEVDKPIARSRLGGLLSATVPRILARGHVLTTSELGQPQKFRQPSAIATLAAIDAFSFNAHLVGVREPWPLDFRVVFPPEIP